MNDNLYKQSFKLLTYFLMMIAAIRFTQGAAATLIAILGIVFAFQGRIARSLFIVLTIAVSVVTNPLLLPKSSIFYTIGVRIGPLIILALIALRGMAKLGRNQLPMGLMLAFLVVAGISSACGYAPLVSYMKLINFTVFFLGIWLGTDQLEGDVAGLRMLRATFFAMIIYIIIGSIILIPFPGISTLDGIKLAKFSSEGVESAYLMNMREALEYGQGNELLCGVINHSQALAGISACGFCWLICDFLFVEGRFRWPHFVLIICVLTVLYLTRSRVALLAFLVSVFMVYFYLSQKMILDAKTRKWLGSLLLVGGGVVNCRWCYRRNSGQ